MLRNGVHRVTCYAAFQVWLCRTRPRIMQVVDIDLAFAEGIESLFRDRAERIRFEMDLEEAERMLRAFRREVLAFVDSRLAQATSKPAVSATAIAAAS